VDPVALEDLLASGLVVLRHGWVSLNRDFQSTSNVTVIRFAAPSIPVPKPDPSPTDTYIIDSTLVRLLKRHRRITLEDVFAQAALDVPRTGMERRLQSLVDRDYATVHDGWVTYIP
jgi:hypothetical protein